MVAAGSMDVNSVAKDLVNLESVSPESTDAELNKPADLKMADSKTADPKWDDPGYDPTAPKVGVGPHPKPWPSGPQYDPALLAEGDTRNVVDKYRYWSVAAIVADLDKSRHQLQIAIQNWEHDFNIGSIVRTANAFNVAAVHIVGKRRWNKRGAMVTNRYLHVYHQPTVADLMNHLAEAGVIPIGVDNLEGSVPLESTQLPANCCLIFGSEGPGLTDEMVANCQQLVAITQYGSTRSMNAGAAAAITMYHWALQHGQWRSS